MEGAGTGQARMGQARMEGAGPGQARPEPGRVGGGRDREGQDRAGQDGGGQDVWLQRRKEAPGAGGGGATAPAAGQLAVLLLGLPGGRDISQDNAVHPARRISVTPEQKQEGGG